MGHVKPNDLRRTLATELLEAGAPVHHVQAQLGHANTQVRRRSGRVRYG